MTVETNASTAPKPFCFVLMPFSEEFDDVYQIGIREACEAAGAYCERVDEQVFEERILDRVYNQIAKADVLIADMTGQNANVFYEVGYAHGLDRSVILLTKSADDIPFDLKHFHHIVYEHGLKELRSSLQRKVEWFIANPRGGREESALGVDLYCEGKNLLQERVESVAKPGASVRPTITIQNNSSRTFYPDDLRLAVLARNEDFRSLGLPTTNGRGRFEPVDVAELPDGKCCFNLPRLDTLFPQSTASVTFALTASMGAQELASSITIRAMTSNGTKDFPLDVRRVPKAAKQAAREDANSRRRRVRYERSRT